MRNEHVIWGLTGGIGSGKSTVASMLADCGASIVDADAQARALTEAGGKAIPALVATWGEGVLSADGAMDRQAMRERVFNSPQDKRQLESILHPMIAHAIQAAIDDAPQRWVFCDVPLLVESRHWRPRLAGVWVVDCHEQTQVARVRQRSQWEEATIEAVIRQQARRADRLASADVVTFNENLALPELRALVGAQANRIGLR